MGKVLLSAIGLLVLVFAIFITGWIAGASYSDSMHTDQEPSPSMSASTVG